MNNCQEDSLKSPHMAAAAAAASPTCAGAEERYMPALLQYGVQQPVLLWWQ
jgi:hypothetical protein